MKIGILTFHYCNNFGAALQAYALKNVLVEMGEDVFFVQHYIDGILPHEKQIKEILNENNTFINKIRLLFFYFKHFSITKQHLNRFNSFRNKYFNERQVLSNQDADLLIIGSDQVWNTKITGQIDKYYWGEFGHRLNIKQISYAASCPSDTIVPEMKSYLSYFDAIGVRENSLKEKLFNVFRIESTCNLDPTLLLSQSEWEKIIGKERIVKDSYIFEYNISDSQKLLEIGPAIEKKLKLTRIGLSSTHLLQKAGPIEFLNLIKNSQISLVSSFHGAVFSVIFHKTFLFFPKGDSTDERVENLLANLGLQQNICYNETNDIQFPKVDWELVEQKLDSLRKESINYLTANIYS